MDKIELGSLKPGNWFRLEEESPLVYVVSDIHKSNGWLCISLTTGTTRILKSSTIVIPMDNDKEELCA